MGRLTSSAGQKGEDTQYRVSGRCRKALCDFQSIKTKMRRLKFLILFAEYKFCVRKGGCFLIHRLQLEIQGQPYKS